MITSLNALGGTHTRDDLNATACDWTAPVSGPYHGIDLVEHPPNGQGATAILMLNILSHFDLKSMDPFGTQRAHIEAEAESLPMTRATALSPIQPPGWITCLHPPRRQSWPP